ncbi:MAG: type II toxin-antitoxin system RatA family toxin [Proteobacteria bacterium]|nr:type II toxin-antitoxin system RatA family toxin [Pseudomonadota bacterium]
MPFFQSTRRVNHPAADMFALVADVERYPEFLPYCTGLKVLRRAVQPDGNPSLIAQMTVGYGPVSENFVSRVLPDQERMRITVQYVEGPFRSLDNRWGFRDAGNGASDVDFSIDYAFKSRAFEMLAGSVFNRLFGKMAEAFEERADALAKARAG